MAGNRRLVDPDTWLVFCLRFGAMVDGMDRHSDSQAQRPQSLCTAARYSLIGLGVACTGLGIAGLLLPVMPGTVFLLIAAWAFSRSSERLHLWLYNHPRFGATIRDWHRFGMVPLRAKVLAIAMMSASVVYVAFEAADSWMTPLVLAAVMAPVALWIATRPSRVSGFGNEEKVEPPQLKIGLGPESPEQTDLRVAAQSRA